MIILSKTKVVHQGTPVSTICGKSLTDAKIIKDVFDIPDKNFCRKCFRNGKNEALMILKYTNEMF